ncbi:hypothetical protein CONCODRAFT_5816 [Conidiobolus coronatus NRRL 28638]|uniref:Uncharacterized protein n=1 Tax=Conidiobolus coronatus (strain ATCC 28846 / CBS 209.66 / NRRL 28638) TaxID=796925 RepID=A0A137P8Z7_CONC2|nr:hypothetical protein CONCODRAFT_5816 [Conidiobolus coronatus NRRL 28638]|eukprot:KXN71475.1 hypothetical protein CONCODRAFT_5816 [Conidiobolus coronatus NRRL 28638]
MSLESVSSVKVGQRVVIIIGNIRGGPTKIDNVSDETAAQVIVNPVTSYALLDKLNVPQVLGRIFVQFAKSRGIKTINLLRCKKLVYELKAIVVNEVLSTEDGTYIVEEIERIANRKLVYDANDSAGGDLGLKISQFVREGCQIYL